MAFLEAIPEDEVRQPLASAMRAVQCGFAYSNALLDDKPFFVAELSNESRVVGLLDQVRDRAVVFWTAQILLRRCESEIVAPVQRIIEEAASLREKLFESLKYLWRRERAR